MLGRTNHLLRRISSRFNPRNFENANAHYYRLLGLSPGASFREIETAFDLKCRAMNIQLTADGLQHVVGLLLFNPSRASRSR